MSCSYGTGGVGGSQTTIVAPPSRRLSARHQAGRAEREDNLATAGKMPALLLIL
jgi:hypothetical protein